MSQLVVLDESALRQFVVERLAKFQDEREKKLRNMGASELLKKKNPYLFRYQGFTETETLLKALFRAWLSSSEEAKFGNVLEDIAIYICEKTFDGQKSASGGIDLEFTRDRQRYLVSIKSGPNWGNSDQIKKMCQNFNTARKRLRQNSEVGEIVAINGCCYGRTSGRYGYMSDGDYYKLCGKEFWELISGDSEMYLKLFDIVAEAADRLAKSDDEPLETSTAIRGVDAKYRHSDGTLDWHVILEEFHSRTAE